MPRFFYNLQSDVSVHDEEGVDLPDRRSAEQEAYEAAGQLILEQIRARRLVRLSHGIEVLDEQGEIVIAFRFRDLMSG